MGLALKLTRALSAPLSLESSNDSKYRVGVRHVNSAGIELIQAFEGMHLEAYYDPVGFPTQGVGRLLSREKWADLSQWLPITFDQAAIWLQEDVDKVGLGIARLFPIPLNDDEYAALASFAFNLGLGALETSTLRRMILRGDRAEAAEQFLRWNKAGGRVLRGLTRRRLGERKLFLSIRD